VLADVEPGAATLATAAQCVKEVGKPVVPHGCCSFLSVAALAVWSSMLPQVLIRVVFG